MEFRIALQELGIKHLKLSEATTPITETNDPYKMIQVHDYKGVSFFRQNPNVKAASTEVIKQFALAYPELLKVCANSRSPRNSLNFLRSSNMRSNPSLTPKLSRP